MARLRSSSLGLFVVVALLGLGCGDDPAPAQGNDETPSGSTGNKKDAGKATPDAGKKGDGGTPAATAAEPVACGTVTCPAPPTSPIPGAPPLKACCFDEESEACSVASPMTGACSEPAVLDPNCPEVTIVGMTILGCCTSNNHCGIDSTKYGLGCSDLADPNVRQLISTAPPPVTCDGEPIELPGGSATPDAGKASADAGTSSAGDAGKAVDAGKAADAGKADASK